MDKLHLPFAAVIYQLGFLLLKLLDQPNDID
jgi:hypothetical protein